MIFASFNPDGDMKHFGEFITKVAIAFGIVATLFFIVMAWLLYSFVAARRQRKADAGQAMRILDDAINKSTPSGL